jgi:hypothetical protein
MMWNDRKTQGRRRLWAAAASLCLLVGQVACNLDEVDVPELIGPSELALSVNLQAIPDVIVADGFSTALIQATVRDQNGRPVQGRNIFFAVSDAGGRFADIGFFQTSNGPGTGATVLTNSQGLAQIVYQSPPRTDFTTNSSVLVVARPVGDDANAQIYRFVRIELRSAEPRLFPPAPTGNSAPLCGFVVEVAPPGSCTGTTTCRAKVNQTVGFQTTASDPDGTIVRYEWFFGDGTKVEYAPDQAHVFHFTGGFTVTHRVTDNFGAQSVCTASITVIP